MISFLRSGIPSAGIFIGPTAWLLNTQINYALVPWICAHKVGLVPLVACIMALVSLLGGFLSWRAFDRSSIMPRADSAGAGRPHRFTAIVGIAMAALFALVILVQGAAGVILHGCER
ncbi:hypothetical protein [Microvirga thermotolerans]|uniref:Uncharacterized protein n=1 Tax=Microvirga thermotolerans TaxID=2651334 RepID=A0A5P9K4V6_9HYPH|nr:hypothetical protein [Microvirga thermotolerans]QFU17504.1 hypothetical protein GDR74_15490 [Microvirga thermotolerans]